MPFIYQAPHTADGKICDVTRDGDGRMLIEVEFELDDDFRRRVDGRRGELEFAARSRIARLGIDIVPRSSIEVNGGTARMVASVRAVVQEYHVAEFLPEVFLPGLPIGRLVFCDRTKRLTSSAVYEAYTEHALQLPAAFSIDATGRFTIQPHRLVYKLSRPLTRDDLVGILARDAGKAALNRMQIPVPVDNVILEPGDGVITSCSMFLHRHYVVLESEPSALGRHMQAIVLDPIATRGPRVFLEFFNDTQEKIVNPSVTGTIYAAEKSEPPVRTWYGILPPQPAPQEDDERHRPSAEAFAEIGKLFGTIDDSGPGARSYFHRPAAVVEGNAEPAEIDPQTIEWFDPVAESPLPTESIAARCRVAQDSSSVKRFATRVLDDVPDGAERTLLLRYFPNLSEHAEILPAAAGRRITRLIFERASFEHGEFLSSRDHGRLADYHDLGIEVFWQNRERRHLVRHVFRGRRGFWCELDAVEAFRTALIVSVYGSSGPLDDHEAERLGGLIRVIREFFGEDVAILTGGGPGSMLQASNFARDLDLLVGANFLEIEDQKTNRIADFYQVFQENCRHARQRWFEIASFPIFCVGGVGTLEEIGMTLTDIKLGLVEGVPLVFFGGVGERDMYWRHLVEQLAVFAEENRGPKWLRSHILMTDDPDRVVRFYREVLSLG